MINQITPLASKFAKCSPLKDITSDASTAEATPPKSAIRLPPTRETHGYEPDLLFCDEDSTFRKRDQKRREKVQELSAQLAEKYKLTKIEPLFITELSFVGDKNTFKLRSASRRIQDILKASLEYVS